MLRVAVNQVAPGGTAPIIALMALAALVLWIAVSGRPASPSRRALWLVGGYLVTTPSLFPWYAAWMVPLLAVHPLWPWLCLTWAVGFTYVNVDQPAWIIPGWVIVAQLGPLALGLGALAWSRSSLAGLARWVGPRAGRASGGSNADRDPRVASRETEGLAP